MDTLGELVQVTRRRNKLSQKELAAKLGVSYGYVSEIELDKKIPSDDLLIRLAHVLDEQKVLEFKSRSYEEFRVVRQSVKMVDGKIQVDIVDRPVDTRIFGHATNFLYIDNEAMADAGISSGNMVGYVPVDTFENRSILVIKYDSEILVRGVTRFQNQIYLVPANPLWPVIKVGDYGSLDIMGSVSTVISKPSTDFFDDYAEKIK